MCISVYNNIIFSPVVVDSSVVLLERTDYYDPIQLVLIIICVCVCVNKDVPVVEWIIIIMTICMTVIHVHISISLILPAELNNKLTD